MVGIFRPVNSSGDSRSERTWDGFGYPLRFCGWVLAVLGKPRELMEFNPLVLLPSVVLGDHLNGASEELDMRTVGKRSGTPRRALQMVGSCTLVASDRS